MVSPGAVRPLPPPSDATDEEQIVFFQRYKPNWALSRNVEEYFDPKPDVDHF